MIKYLLEVSKNRQYFHIFYDWYKILKITDIDWCFIQCISELIILTLDIIKFLVYLQLVSSQWSCSCWGQPPPLWQPGGLAALWCSSWPLHTPSQMQWLPSSWTLWQADGIFSENQTMKVLLHRTLQKILPTFWTMLTFLIPKRQPIWLSLFHYSVIDLYIRLNS